MSCFKWHQGSGLSPPVTVTGVVNEAQKMLANAFLQMTAGCIQLLDWPPLPLLSNVAEKCRIANICLNQ